MGPSREAGDTGLLAIEKGRTGRDSETRACTLTLGGTRLLAEAIEQISSVGFVVLTSLHDKSTAHRRVAGEVTEDRWGMQCD